MRTKWQLKTELSNDHPFENRCSVIAQNHFARQSWGGIAVGDFAWRFAFAGPFLTTLCHRAARRAFPQGACQPKVS